MEQRYLEEIYWGRINQEPALVEKWLSPDQHNKILAKFDHNDSLEQWLAKFGMKPRPPKPPKKLVFTEVSDNKAVRSKQLHWGHRVASMMRILDIQDYLDTGKKEYSGALKIGDYIKYNYSFGDSIVYSDILKWTSELTKEEKKGLLSTINNRYLRDLIKSKRRTRTRPSSRKKSFLV